MRGKTAFLQERKPPACMQKDSSYESEESAKAYWPVICASLGICVLQNPARLDLLSGFRSWSVSRLVASRQVLICITDGNLAYHSRIAL
jgi:hypothetical protein